MWSLRAKFVLGVAKVREIVTYMTLQKNCIKIKHCTAKIIPRPTGLPRPRSQIPLRPCEETGERPPAPTIHMCITQAAHDTHTAHQIDVVCTSAREKLLG
jgi:hypothetical protein